MMDPERVATHLEKGVIEVAPLAFMRGRTLNDSFVILDEAQNTTPEQMKMFLTRLGFGSRMVVTGDVTQVDLPRDQKSGLIVVGDILKDIEGVEFVRFGGDDVVRHKLVQRIVEAYDSHDRPAAARGEAGSPPTQCRHGGSAGECRCARGGRRSHTGGTVRRPPPGSGGGPARTRRDRSGLMLDVEVIGGALPSARVQEAVAYAAASAGIEEGHVAVEFVNSERIAELNLTWRGKVGPTDVLSFPVDEDDEDPFGERELGDVFICPELTENLVEAVVHGVLHLTGMDHETDDGEMLALQAEIMGWLQ